MVNIVSENMNNGNDIDSKMNENEECSKTTEQSEGKKKYINILALTHTIIIFDILNVQFCYYISIEDDNTITSKSIQHQPKENGKKK